jgi:hypothetical protein
MGFYVPSRQPQARFLREHVALSHAFIPPAAHTYNSDVETVHPLCEDEFCDREDFASRSHFLQKAQSYWLHFNVARRNSSKHNRSPLEMLRHITPQLNPRISVWRSAFLEDRVHILLPKEIQRLRGKDLPAHPFQESRVELHRLILAP